MKKIIPTMLIAFTLFCTNNASAQKGFSFTVKAVPQFSFLLNKTDYDNNQYESKATFNAGFGVGTNYNFTTNAGIGLDVLYSLQGQTYKLNDTEYKQKVEYLKIPLMLTCNTNPAKLVSFVGKIGPQVSLRTNSKLEDKNGKDLIGDTNDKYQSATFGGVALGGAQFRLNSKMFLTSSIRFDIDFTDAENKDYINYTAGRDKTYNSTVGIEVGLKVLLK